MPAFHIVLCCFLKIYFCLMLNDHVSEERNVLSLTARNDCIFYRFSLGFMINYTYCHCYQSWCCCICTMLRKIYTEKNCLLWRSNQIEMLFINCIFFYLFISWFIVNMQWVSSFPLCHYQSPCCGGLCCIIVLLDCYLFINIIYLSWRHLFAEI